MVGVKHDKGKPRIDLVPPNAILEVAEVLTSGAEEYGEHNWKEGIAYSRLYAAIQRHLLAFWKGNDIDKSGHGALAHACTDIMMLMEMSPEWDDRYRPEAHVPRYYYNHKDERIQENREEVAMRTPITGLKKPGKKKKNKGI